MRRIKGVGFLSSHIVVLIDNIAEGSNLILLPIWAPVTESKTTCIRTLGNSHPH